MAAFVLPVRGGRVLLARHRYGPPVWAMVGGVVEAAERLEEAARREALEETGLPMSVGALLATADRGDLILHVFGATVDEPSASPSPQAQKIAELAWFDLEDLESRQDVFDLVRTLAPRLLERGSSLGSHRVDLAWPDGREVPVYLSSDPPDPLQAVLAPPSIPSFRRLTGVDDEALEVATDGWSKLAILSRDRVFLFPRRGREEGLLRGARACQVLSEAGLEFVPQVHHIWDGENLPEGPFVGFQRRWGKPWASLENTATLADIEAMMASLRQAIGRWHSIPHRVVPLDLRGPLRSVPSRR